MALRFERATVYEGAQWGVETTPGTRVPAIKRILGLSVEFDHMTDRKPYRPQGNKFNTTSQTGKEWTQGKITGIQCFNDLLYIASSWLTSTTPIIPANNSTFTVPATNGLTLGFTYKGAVLAPAVWANAAALQAAIGALAPVGVDNVKVTGTPSTEWTIKFIGALSTDTSTISAITGTSSVTLDPVTGATLTRRWKFVMAPFCQDDVVTFSIEKGANCLANMAQVAAFCFATGMQFKFNKSEASLSGDFAGQTTIDPFTMTTASVVDVACIPVDPSAMNVWIGTSTIAPSKVDRVLDYEFGVTNRAAGLMTLNADDPSFSNRVEMAPALTSKFFMEHDSNGQIMLARLRAGTNIITTIEALGPLIETGFNYRMKWTLSQTMLKPSLADLDGVYGANYDSELVYNTVLGTAIQLEIDTPLATL